MNNWFSIRARKGEAEIAIYEEIGAFGFTAKDFLAELKTVDAVGGEDIDLKALEASLQKVTSPSSVSDEIKNKIDAHHSFYETGTQIVQEEHRTTCPFCEQGITAPDPKAVIDAYVICDLHRRHATDRFRWPCHHARLVRPADVHGLRARRGTADCVAAVSSV